MPPASTPAATMPQASAPRRRRRRRVDRDDDARERRRRARPAPPRSRRASTARRGGPRSSRRRAPGARAACRRSARTTCVEERRREVARRCRRCAARRHRDARVGEQAAGCSGIGRGVVVTSWRGRAPRRRPNCSMSQVSCAWRHLRELVRPGGLELRPAQANPGPRPRTHARRRRSAIRACAATATSRGRSPRRVDREEPGRALDHHVAHVGEGLADERDAADAARVAMPGSPSARPVHPFGAGARLAGAAPAEHEPGRPVVARALGRQLMIVQRTDAPPHELEHVARPLKQVRRRRLAVRNTRQVGA